MASADHQVEAFRADGQDIRDLWESTRGLVPRGQATDFWTRYSDDIARAGELGCRYFRLSVSWSRLEPSPGKFDDHTFDHYAAVLRAIRNAGMKSILTLHHFTWPLHVEDRGGMTAEAFPRIFEAFAAQVARRLGHLVDLWVTFNEPTQLIHGYIKPASEAEYAVPPGLPPETSIEDQQRHVSALIRNLFLAHASARTAIRSVCPGAPVGANPLILGFPGWIRALAECSAQRLRNPGRLRAQIERYSRRRTFWGSRLDVVLASFTRTLDREREVAFSEPYYVAQRRILVRADSRAMTVSDLAGVPIAVVHGSTAAAGLTETLPGTHGVICADVSAALAAVTSGEASGWLSDDVLLAPWVADESKFRLLPGDLGLEPYCVAVAKRQSDLLVPITQVLHSFKTRMAAPSPGHSLGITAPPSEERHPAYLARGFSSLRAPSPSVDRLRRRRRLRVGLRADPSALSWRDPDGRWQGLEPDLGRAIAAHLLGTEEVRFQPLQPDQRVRALRLWWLWPWVESVIQLYSTLFTLITADWWSLGMAGKLPEYLCPLECRGTQDYVGLDYYWGISWPWPGRIQRLLDAGRGHFARAPVWPSGLFRILKRLARRFPGLPIHLMENGCVERADETDRGSYLRAHVAEVRKARARGVPLETYVCWSITSNREWGYPFGPETDFGLFHIGLDTDPSLMRRPTESATIYAALVQESGGESLLPEQK